MKRLVLTAAVSMLCAIFMSSEASAQLAVYAGYQRAQYIEGKADDKPFNGFRLRWDYTWMFHKYLGTSLGVGYSFDTRTDGEFQFPGEVSASHSTQEQYAYIPLRLVINLPVYKDFAIELYGGAAVSYAIKGTETFDFTDGVDEPLSFTYDMYADKISSDDLPPYIIDAVNSRIGRDKYERFGIEMLAGAGLRLTRNIRLEGGLSWCLTNQLKNDEDGDMKRKLWTVGISYVF